MNYRIGDALSRDERAEAKRDAINHFNEIVSLSRGDDQSVARVLVRLAALHYVLKDKREKQVADGYVDRVLKLYEGRRVEPRAALEVRQVLLEAEQGQKARELYERLLADYKADGNLAGQAETLARISFSYVFDLDPIPILGYKGRLSSEPKAVEYLSRAIEVYKRAFDKKLTPSIDPLLDIGSYTFETIVDQHLAFDAYQTANAFMEYSNYGLKEHALTYRRLGNMYYDREELEKARDSWGRARALYTELNRTAITSNDVVLLDEGARAIRQLDKNLDAIRFQIEQQKKERQASPQPSPRP